MKNHKSGKGKRSIRVSTRANTVENLGREEVLKMHRGTFQVQNAFWRSPAGLSKLMRHHFIGPKNQKIRRVSIGDYFMIFSFLLNRSGCNAMGLNMYRKVRENMKKQGKKFVEEKTWNPWISCKAEVFLDWFGYGKDKIRGVLRALKKVGLVHFKLGKEGAWHYMIDYENLIEQLKMVRPDDELDTEEYYRMEGKCVASLAKEQK